MFICSIVFTNSSKCNINCVIVWFQPPKIKAFIDKVIQCPLQDIGIPLSGFHWEYSKVMSFKFCEQEFYFCSHHLYAILFIFQGNFHHWRPLFLHFDTFFKVYLSCRNDLTLSDRILEDESPLPKYAVMQILRVMQIILENCPNKSSFDGLEVSCSENILFLVVLIMCIHPFILPE